MVKESITGECAAVVQSLSLSGPLFFLSPPCPTYLVLVLYTPFGNASFLLFKWVWLVVHAWVCFVVMAMFVYERYV